MIKDIFLNLLHVVQRHELVLFCLEFAANCQTVNNFNQFSESHDITKKNFT